MQVHCSESSLIPYKLIFSHVYISLEKIGPPISLGLLRKVEEKWRTWCQSSLIVEDMVPNILNGGGHDAKHP